MNTDLRRSRRYNDFLPISVAAISGVNKEIFAGPFSGRIIDISRHGACLLMTQVLLKTYHVYHSTIENDSNSLQLNINIPPDLVNFAIPAMPVWLRPFNLDEIKAFRMGVDFLISPDGEQMLRLENVMRKKQTQRDDLWNSMAMPYIKKDEEKE